MDLSQLQCHDSCPAGVRAGVPPPGAPWPEPSVLPSAGQPIKFAHSVCEAGTAELHIQDALPEDRGTYTCLAENALGQVSCSARVTVQGRILQAFPPPALPVCFEGRVLL